MKEILKHGANKFIGTCNICGCQFSYSLQDLTVGGGNCLYCPECDHIVVHSLNNRVEENTGARDINEVIDSEVEQ